MSDVVQPTTENNEKKSRGFGIYVLWAFVAVTVYFLSAGPMSLLDKAGIFNSPKAQRVLEVIYAPVEYLYEETLLRRPIGMYLHLWRPDVFDVNGQGIVY
jgi:hypothetical protein